MLLLESINTQYYVFNSAFNATRATYISTYSLVIVDVIGLPIWFAPWVLTINLLATMMAEVPTGIFADIWSRRDSFVFACIITTLGYLIYAILGIFGKEISLLTICGLIGLAEIFLAVGFTFYSGALDAWVVDSGLEKNDSELQKIFSRGQAYKNLYYSLFGLIGCFVYFIIQTAYFSTFTLASILCAVLTIHASFQMTKDLSSKTHLTKPLSARQYFSNALAILEACVRLLRNDLRIGFILMALSISVLYLQILVFFWPYYAVHELVGGTGEFTDLGLAVTVAISWVLGYSARMLGNVIASARWCLRQPKLGIAVSLVASALPVAIFALAPSWLRQGASPQASFAAVVLAFAISRFGEGMGDPLRQVFLHRLLPGEWRATMVSISSTFSMLVSAIGLGATSVALSFDMTVSDLWAIMGCLLLSSYFLYHVGVASKGESHASC